MLEVVTRLLQEFQIHLQELSASWFLIREGWLRAPGLGLQQPDNYNRFGLGKMRSYRSPGNNITLNCSCNYCHRFLRKNWVLLKELELEYRLVLASPSGSWLV